MSAGGFVLDGFPRTVAQAVALDEIMSGRRAPLIVIDIAVPDDALVARLVATAGLRGVAAQAYGAAGGDMPAACTRCGAGLVQRSDDREDVVRERLRVYHEQTQPLVAFYEDRPSFRRVEGNQPPDAVHAALGAAIDDALGAARRQPPAGG